MAKYARTPAGRAAAAADMAATGTTMGRRPTGPKGPMVQPGAPSGPKTGANPYGPKPANPRVTYGPRGPRPKGYGLNDGGPSSVGPRGLGPKGYGLNDGGPRPMGPRITPVDVTGMPVGGPKTGFNPADGKPANPRVTYGPSGLGPRGYGPNDGGPRSMGPSGLGPKGPMPSTNVLTSPPGLTFKKGGSVKSKAMRGGGLARKGVGMALAKGGLARRAGGCAKRGVGKGKMV